MPRVNKDRLPDEILSFLGHELFQIPVRQFMDDNCLLFDRQIPVSEEHKKVHQVYRKLVDTLLETFCKDAGITFDEVKQAITKMESIEAIQEVFQMLFEQIEASVSFDVFYKVMEARNLQIQQQVLAMILTMTGGELPECMTPMEERHARKPAGVIAPVSDEQDERVMAEAMRKSVRDHERETSKRRSDEKLLRDTMELSRHEAEVAQRNRREIEEGLSKLALIDEPHKRAASASEQRQSVPEPAVYAPPRKGGGKGKSSADAASDWLLSARAEATGSYTHSAASDSGGDAELMKKRAEFFKEQREKLLARKKEEREKLLARAEHDGPQRPCSARAARQAIDEPHQPTAQDKEDEKRMQLKLAIAEKLRQEVLNN